MNNLFNIVKKLMKLSKKWSITLLIFITLIASYWFFSSNNHPQFHYITETVHKGTIDKTVLATGSARAYQRIKVGAQVSGKLQKIYVKLGETVKKGQILAEIDSTNQQNSLDTTEAQLTAHQAQLNAKKIALELAQSIYQRNYKLYQQKSLSLNELNNSKNSLALAQANLEEIKAQIKIAKIAVNTAKTNLSYTKISSPIDGLVVSIPLAEGQTLNANQNSPTILQVADVSKVLIKLEIAESDIPLIQIGQSVRFSTLADPYNRFTGTIESIDPALTTLTDDNYSESSGNNSAVYYYANVIVNNQNQQLRIGMTTQNRIEIAKKEDVLIVPLIALKQQGHKTVVSVLENDKPIEKTVKVGLSDNLHAEITEGLIVGEQVITTQQNIKERNNNTVRMRF